MDPNDLVAIAEIQNGTLDDLPYDVKRELFRYIPTRNLIGVWRLVSTDWSRFATELCRQRSVTLRLPRLDEIFSAPIGHLFPKMDNLPFSKVHLALDNQRTEWHAYSNYVARRFGRHVTSAQISIRLHNYQAFFYTLVNTPNLAAIEILPKGESRDNENDEEDFTFRFEHIALPELKSLKMVYEPNTRFVKILEVFLRQLSAQLDSVDLQLISDPRCSVNDSVFNRCVDLICARTFPKLSLGLPLEAQYSDGWKTLVSRGPLNIQSLAVSSYKEDLTSDLLTPFLVNCSGLTSLTLEGFQKRSLTSKQCRVPVMPTVKKLSISSQFTLPENEPSRLQFEPFTAQQFPSLKEVTVHCRGSYDVNRGEFDVRHFFDVSGGRFLGVTSLDIGCTPSTTNWADAFPNVRKLSAVMCRRTKRHSQIFENMTQVTDLDLEIEGRYVGLLQFLHDLKNLQNLTLRFLEFGDEVAAFLALSPLHLRIFYYERKASDFCLSLLSSRHLSLELKEGD